MVTMDRYSKKSEVSDRTVLLSMTLSNPERMDLMDLILEAKLLA